MRKGKRANFCAGKGWGDDLAGRKGRQGVKDGGWKEDWMLALLNLAFWRSPPLTSCNKNLETFCSHLDCRFSRLFLLLILKPCYSVTRIIRNHKKSV